MLIVGIVIAVLIALIWVLWFMLPKAEQHDRKKSIERSMRQEIIDQEVRRQFAQKLLNRAGQK